MATLLHQKSYMKTITSHENAHDANDENAMTTTTEQLLDAGSQGPQQQSAKVLMPHEMVNMMPTGHTHSLNSYTNENHHFSGHFNHGSSFHFNSYSPFGNGANVSGSTNNHLNGHHAIQFNSFQQTNHNQQSYPPIVSNFYSSNIKPEHDVENTENNEPPPADQTAPINELPPTDKEITTTEMVDPDAPVEEPEPEPEIDIVINNVVCSFGVRCHLNLREIALNACNVEYKRENGMVTMKLRRPYTTASIWSSGKITCTGATSEDQAKIAARKYSRALQNLGFRVHFQNFRVVNVLGTCSMPWAIKITAFSEKYKKEASYEPELHPGVTYRIKEPKATLKIFSTGSITVTAISVASVQSAIETIFPLVYEFRKPRPPKVVTLAPDPLIMSSDDDFEQLDSEGDGEPFKKKLKKSKPFRKQRRPPGKSSNDSINDNFGVSSDESDKLSDDENDN